MISFLCFCKTNDNKLSAGFFILSFSLKIGVKSSNRGDGNTVTVYIHHLPAFGSE